MLCGNNSLFKSNMIYFLMRSPPRYGVLLFAFHFQWHCSTVILISLTNSPRYKANIVHIFIHQKPAQPLRNGSIVHVQVIVSVMYKHAYITNISNIGDREYVHLTLKGCRVARGCFRWILSRVRFVFNSRAFETQGFSCHNSM